MKHLILGGARSGKSRYAEQICMELSAKANLQKVYIATAAAGDAEMARRIEHHQARRDQNWGLIEEGFALGERLKNAAENECVLIDCLTLWLSNCMHKGNWQEQRELFLSALNDCQCNVILVSNEVGSGVIPMGELSREFVDEIGFLHQAVAKICDSVTLTVAGLPMHLKTAAAQEPLNT